MYILHLPSSYFPDYIGGTEVYVETLLSSLREFGCDGSVVVHSSRTALLGERGADAIRLPPISITKTEDLYNRSTRRDPPGFAELLSNQKPDLVHFHALTLGAGVDHARVCLRLGVPYVITYHTPAMSCARGTLLRWGDEPCAGQIDPKDCSACVLQSRGIPRFAARAVSLLPLAHTSLPGRTKTVLGLRSLLVDGCQTWNEFYNGARHVFACAEFCRDVLIKNGLPADQITVVRQGLPGETRKRILRNPLDSQIVRIGYFGRINQAKGADLLIPLVHGLQKRGINASGEWVGPLDGSEEFNRGVLSSSNTVSYRGVKSGAELSYWIRSIDLIVIPSRWLETGPLTLLEAWDHERPVIGTNRGGIRDFLTANGLENYLFEADSINGMVSTAERVIRYGMTPNEVAIPGMRHIAERIMVEYSKISNSANKIMSVANG